MSIPFFNIQLRSSQNSNLSSIRMSKYRLSIVSRTLLRFVNTAIKASKDDMIVYLLIFIFLWRYDRSFLPSWYDGELFPTSHIITFSLSLRRWCGSSRHRVHAFHFLCAVMLVVSALLLLVRLHRLHKKKGLTTLQAFVASHWQHPGFQSLDVGISIW